MLSAQVPRQHCKAFDQQTGCSSAKLIPLDMLLLTTTVQNLHQPFLLVTASCLQLLSMLCVPSLPSHMYHKSSQLQPWHDRLSDLHTPTLPNALLQLLTLRASLVEALSDPDAVQALLLPQLSNVSHRV